MHSTLRNALSFFCGVTKVLVGLAENQADPPDDPKNEGR